MTAAIIVGVSQVLLAVGMFEAQSHLAGRTAPEERLQLRVFVHARLDEADVDLARETVRTLLSSSGIRSEWRDCPLGQACGDPNALRRVTVRLVPTNVKGGSACGQVTGDLAHDATILVYVPRIVTALERCALARRGG